jgi:tetratricopeptide (TPR) repeat protein
MFIRGRVATSDGARVPSDMLIERVCSARTRQQVYASSTGDFTMQLGSVADSFLDASGERSSQLTTSRNPIPGIPRHDLATCEIRASASGFRPKSVMLAEFAGGGMTIDSSIDVGAIVVQRNGKPGKSINAAAYKAPTDARKAYEKGIEAERKAKLDAARAYFEKAVELYPRYAYAWFQLGSILQQGNQPDAARKAFMQAATVDAKFLPPYLSLASIAYHAEDWTEVLKLTGHILSLDPLGHAASNEYILELDSFNFAGAYFYNAVANYKLNHIEEAEKSGLKAEHLDMRTHYPELHLLLAEIFTSKNNYDAAIDELESYLQLVPRSKQSDKVRERVGDLRKLSVTPTAADNPKRN